jgi:deoxyadenosine/deoxycytidine kinase
MYVAFEGVIGAGKTTLATMLAEELGRGAQLVLEDFQGNSFLEDFYSDRERWALPMQLEFLASRYEQTSRLNLSQSTVVVSDYSFEKDALFASLLLSGREMDLYGRIASTLTGICPRPDLIVYLEVDTSVLLARIRQRNRSYEASISAEYLESLGRAYRSHLSTLPDSNVLLIENTENLTSVEIRSKVIPKALEAMRAVVRL